MATKEKFEEAKRLYETANADQRYVLESLFPELKESDDERIRIGVANTETELAFKAGAGWQKNKDNTIVGKDLKQAADNALESISDQYDIISVGSCLEMFRLGAKWQKEQFEKDYTNLCNGIATVKGLAVAMAYNKGVADTKEQMTKNIWKDAQGDDLPEIDREVIALLDNGKVVFAHRPYKGKYIGKNLTTGNIETFENKVYDKGGWNQPDVKYWLDCFFPNIEED